MEHVERGLDTHGVRHVFWDWNGTLLDDTPLTVKAAMAALDALGTPRVVSVDEWRDIATRPLIISYETLAGRTITPDEWDMAGKVWYAVYQAGLPEVQLHPDALAALDQADARGMTQSIISIHEQDQLRVDVAALGIADRFTQIIGASEQPASTGRYFSKAEVIQAQLERMGLEPGEALMIGDNINDGLEAAQAGVTAILVPTGDTSRRRLVESGFPLADSLINALNGVITSL